MKVFAHQSSCLWHRNICSGWFKKEKLKTHYRVEQQHVSVGSYLCAQQFCSPIISVAHHFPTEHCEVAAMSLFSRCRSFRSSGPFSINTRLERVVLYFLSVKHLRAYEAVLFQS